MRRILLQILLCFSLHLSAEEVAGLYRGLVPVADQTVASTEQAVREALAQVLIKLTGNSHVMQLPSVQPFLTDPDAYVTAVGFRNLLGSGLAGENQAGLEVSFSRQAIDQLIRQAQLTVLPSNRPRLLVWMIRDDIRTGRQFINEYTAQQYPHDHQLAELLQSFDLAMKTRGMPYMMPSYDLEDQLSLSVNQAWSLQADLIDQASQRYKPDGWVALRFYTTSTGEVRGAWLLQSADYRRLDDFRSEAGGSLAGEVFHRLIDDLAQAYTYVPQINTNQLLVQINGVEAFEDYQAVLKQFKKLELVDSLDVVSIRGDQLILAIEIEGGMELLHSSLLRNDHFESLISSERSEGQLQYNWIGQ